jgi:hypothetical protein
MGGMKMPYQARWLIEHRIFYTQVTGEFTLEDEHIIAGLLLHGLNQTEQSTYVIADMLAVTQFPINPRQILDASRWLRHSKLGWIIHIADHRVLTMLARIVTNLTSAHYQQCQTLADALDFIEALEPALAEQMKALKSLKV